MPNSSTDTDDADWSRLYVGIYLTSWVLFFVFGLLGVTLHFGPLGVDGPRITFFGAPVGEGWTICTVLFWTGLVAGLWSGSKVEGTRWRLAAVGLVVVASAGLLFSWQDAMLYTWQTACSNGDAHACDAAAGMADLLGDEDQSRSAYRKGCLEGAAPSCEWLLEHDVSLETDETACRLSAERCRTWKRCRAWRRDRDGVRIDDVDCDRFTYTNAVLGEENHCRVRDEHCAEQGGAVEEETSPPPPYAPHSGPSQR